MMEVSGEWSVSNEKAGIVFARSAEPFRDVHRIFAFVIEREASEPEADLVKVVYTGGLARPRLGRDQCGKEQGGEDGHDADHRQQLDQTERTLSLRSHPVRSKAQGVPG